VLSISLRRGRFLPLGRMLAFCIPARAIHLHRKDSIACMKSLIMSLMLNRSKQTSDPSRHHCGFLDCSRLLRQTTVCVKSDRLASKQAWIAKCCSYERCAAGFCFLFFEASAPIHLSPVRFLDSTITFGFWQIEKLSYRCESLSPKDAKKLVLCAMRGKQLQTR
jgi:hypothetical protein